MYPYSSFQVRFDNRVIIDTAEALSPINCLIVRNFSVKHSVCIVLTKPVDQFYFAIDCIESDSIISHTPRCKMLCMEAKPLMNLSQYGRGAIIPRGVHIPYIPVFNTCSIVEWTVIDDRHQQSPFDRLLQNPRRLPERTQGPRPGWSCCPPYIRPDRPPAITQYQHFEAQSWQIRTRFDLFFNQCR